MSTRTIWTCDGCGGERVIDERSDWRLITVQLDGFAGYPVGAEYNEVRGFHLCPDCQRHLVEVADPGNWPRAG